HRAAAGQVVELDDAARDVERVVVRQRDDAGAEHDPLRALAGRGEEQLGGADGLPAAGGGLAGPQRGVAERVGRLRGVERAARRLRPGVLADRVVGGEERAELHASVWHARLYHAAR